MRRSGLTGWTRLYSAWRTGLWTPSGAGAPTLRWYMCAQACGWEGRIEVGGRQWRQERGRKQGRAPSSNGVPMAPSDECTAPVKECRIGRFPFVVAVAALPAGDGVAVDVARCAEEQLFLADVLSDRLASRVRVGEGGWVKGQHRWGEGNTRQGGATVYIHISIYTKIHKHTGGRRWATLVSARGAPAMGSCEWAAPEGWHPPAS